MVVKPLIFPIQYYFNGKSSIMKTVVKIEESNKQECVPFDELTKGVWRVVGENNNPPARIVFINSRTVFFVDSQLNSIQTAVTEVWGKRHFVKDPNPVTVTFQN